MAEFNLTPAQAAAVHHRGGALLISAGAGSGKTRVLVERLMALVAEGHDIDRFLIITYTRAAAAELRGRILDALNDRLRDDPGNPRLRRQTALLLQATIGTIHSFCSSVLRENAHLCGIRPDFRQLDGGEESILRNNVLREVLQARYDDLTADFSALADTLGAGRDDSQLMEVVLDAYDKVQSHPDPEAWLTTQIEAPVPDCDAGQTIWGEPLIRSARANAAFWEGRMLELIQELEAEPKLASAYAPSLRGTAVSLEGFCAALDTGWDAAAAHGAIEFPALGRAPNGMANDPLAQLVKSQRESCKKSMARLTALFDGASRELMNEARAVKPVTDALFRLVRDFSEAYSAEKRKKGVLDFGDLEHLTLRLLTEPDGVSPSDTAKTLSLRFDEIFVDEYQDCNQVQDRIFFAASRNGQNVTMVGDVKQSIYRFRLADPTIFLRKYAEYKDEPGPGEGKRILLSENFRSDSGVLLNANRFFRAVMSPELGDMAYGNNEALKPGANNPAEDGAFRLYVPEYGDGERAKAEPEAVADYVAWLLSADMTVPEGNSRRPLRPGDIAILLRATRNKDGLYAEALKKRGIPAQCLKSADPLRERPEVRWALSLLTVTDNPRQDIPLLTALRSPVWHFSEDELAGMRCADRDGCLYDALTAAAETDGHCAAVLAQLRGWREQSRKLSAEELLSSLYAQTQLYALAEAREPGSGANLDQLLDYARSFAGADCRSLFGFLTRLRESEELGGDKMTAVFGGGDGVIITTIHGSKGLEYPVVILADLMKRFNRMDENAPLLIHPALGAGMKWTDPVRGIRYDTLMRLAIARKLRSESLSEELRVLYVAMTRPKQRLAVFLPVQDREKARKDYLLSESSPLPPELLSGCDSMGKWLLAASLAFGEMGDWAWRDVPKPGEAIPAETAAEAETEGDIPVEEIRAALGWEYPYAAETRFPSKVTATALRDSALAAETAENASELVRREWTARDFAAPAFLRPAELSAAEKGTAMHLAMQYADFAGCETVEGAAEAVRKLREKRMLTPMQCDAVKPEKLAAFVNSEVGKLLQSGILHREFKFSLLAPVRELLGTGAGETLLQGVVDLWAETNEGILLLDYKTDRVTRENQRSRAERYAPQLRAYAWALKKITGKPVIRTFVWFFETDAGVEITAG